LSRPPCGATVLGMRSERGQTAADGALNEAISDIFASNVDGNWQIGEDLPGGAMRGVGLDGAWQAPEVKGC
jgi:hypothetical protein